MSELQKVQVFSLGLPPKGTPTAKRRCRVKWRIDGRDRTRAFKTRAEADRYRRQLLDAVEAGEAFDDLDGEPASWSAASMTWLTWTQRWIELKWPHWAGTTRRTAVETLAAITPRMVKAKAPAPPAEIVDWLRADGYIPGSDGWADVPAWLDRWSIPLDEITPHLLERVLTEITTRQDGKAMTAAVSRRRRNTLGAVLRAAVKRDLLVSNPLDKAEWRTPERDMTIDVATVPSTPTCSPSSTTSPRSTRTPLATAFCSPASVWPDSARPRRSASWPPTSTSRRRDELLSEEDDGKPTWALLFPVMVRACSPLSSHTPAGPRASDTSF